MNKIEFGDCRETMRKWATEGVKVQTCVTSPPYFGLRDYGHEGQIGLEQTPEEYIAAMVEVFRCVWDVLANDGTLWLNLGDSYGSVGGNTYAGFNERWSGTGGAGSKQNATLSGVTNRKISVGLKPKNLLGIPWKVAFALQADGWILRQDIIWHKPNPMPESVRDRCTKAHEYIFLLSKSDKYFFDSEAMRERGVMTAGDSAGSRQRDTKLTHGVGGGNDGINKAKEKLRQELIEKGYTTRNRRSVWTVTTKPYKGAHFATFPPDLIEPCILAGSRSSDIVLDPFMGSGTTAQVAVENNRRYLGCELNPEYEKLQADRLKQSRLEFA
jgi:DNA modification methylase